MNKSFVLGSLLIGMFIMGCEKDEIPIHITSTGTLSDQVIMGADYKSQIFYSLNGNEIISQNNRTDWDLGFESAVEGWHIILNTSRGMAVSLTNESNLTEVKTVVDAEWHYDSHTGNLDSTAFGAWSEHNNVYIIDLGVDEMASKLGFVKIKIETVSETQYSFSFAKISEDFIHEVLLPKDPLRNFVCFSLINDSVVYIQPESDSWDLCFTQYTHLFKDPPTPYLVNGVLANRKNTSIAQVKDIPYEDLSHEQLEILEFSHHINVIGYDWKWFNFDEGAYTIVPNLFFVYRDVHGVYYKIRFLDFYDDIGKKGAPEFEFERL